MTDPTSSALDFYHRMPTTATETAIRVRRTYDQIDELHEHLRQLRILCDHEFGDPIWNVSNTVTEFCIHCGQRRVSAPRPGFVDPQPLGPSYDLSDLPDTHPPTDAEFDLPTHAGGWGDEYVHPDPPVNQPGSFADRSSDFFQYPAELQNQPPVRRWLTPDELDDPLDPLDPPAK